MAVTTSANVVIPEILEGAVRGVVAAGLPVMLGTGAAIFKTGFPAGQNDVGSTVKVPYFGSLGDAEDVASDGDSLTVATFAQTSENATVLHSGKAFEMTFLAQHSSAPGDDGSGLYDEGKRQIAEVFTRRIDLGLITAASSATSWSAYTNDQSATSGGVTYDMCVNTLALSGDEGFMLSDMAAIVCHSKVMGDFLKLKTTDGAPVLMGNFKDGEMPRFLGIPIIVSDRTTVVAGSPNTYKTLFLKRGSLVAWVNENVDVLTDKDILAHTDVCATHMYWAAHRYSRLPGRSKPGVSILISQ